MVEWQSEMLERLGDAEEPPSLYYLKNPSHWGERLLDDGLEEYRRLLQSTEPHCTLLYRCYRNRGDDTFQLGLYVFS